MSIEQTTAFEEAAAALSRPVSGSGRAPAFQAVLERGAVTRGRGGPRPGPVVAAETRTRRSSTWSARTRDSANGETCRGPPARRCGSSREYQAVRGNAAASNGWYARAEGLLRDARRRPSTAGSRSPEPSVRPIPRRWAIAPRRRTRSPWRRVIAISRRQRLPGAGTRSSPPARSPRERIASTRRWPPRPGVTSGASTCRRHHVRRDRGVRALGGLAADRAVGPGDGVVDPEP